MHGIFYAAALCRPVVATFGRNFLEHSQIAQDFAAVVAVEFGIERRNHQAQNVERLKRFVLVFGRGENFQLGNISVRVNRADKFKLRREFVAEIFFVDGKRRVNRQVQIRREFSGGRVVSFTKSFGRDTLLERFFSTDDGRDDIFQVGRRGKHVDKKRDTHGGKNKIRLPVEGEYLYMKSKPSGGMKISNVIIAAIFM